MSQAQSINVNHIFPKTLRLKEIYKTSSGPKHKTTLTARATTEWSVCVLCAYLDQEKRLGPRRVEDGPGWLRKKLLLSTQLLAPTQFEPRDKTDS